MSVAIQELNVGIIDPYIEPKGLYVNGNHETSLIMNEKPPNPYDFLKQPVDPEFLKKIGATMLPENNKRPDSYNYEIRLLGRHVYAPELINGKLSGIAFKTVSDEQAYEHMVLGSDDTLDSPWIITTLGDWDGSIPLIKINQNQFSIISPWTSAGFGFYPLDKDPSNARLVTGGMNINLVHNATSQPVSLTVSHVLNSR